MLRITTEQKEVVEKFEKTMQQLARSGTRSSNRAATTAAAPDAELLLDEIQSSIEDLEDMRRSADDISASVSPCIDSFFFLGWKE